MTVSETHKDTTRGQRKTENYNYGSWWGAAAYVFLDNAPKDF